MTDDDPVCPVSHIFFKSDHPQQSIVIHRPCVTYKWMEFSISIAHTNNWYLYSVITSHKDDLKVLAASLFNMSFIFKMLRVHVWIDAESFTRCIHTQRYKRAVESTATAGSRPRLDRYHPSFLNKRGTSRFAYLHTVLNFYSRYVQSVTMRLPFVSLLSICQ